MTTTNRIKSALTLLSLAMVGLTLPVTAKTIPAQLPDPDGKAGDATRPVKVYILAGQSNMVGMGDISGARCRYTGIYLTPDRAAPKGPRYVGGWRTVYKISPLGVYVSADANAEEGATASVYKGAYNAGTDYDKAKPAKTETVALGVVQGVLPTIDGPHTVVVRGYIEVPVSGTYTLNSGYGDSTCNVTALDGKEVYRKDVGGQAVKQEVALEAGKRYPIRITYLEGGSTAFWMSQQDLVGYGDLEIVTKRDKKFQYLVDDEGKWTVRNDVYFQEARIAKDGRGCPLSATSNGRSIGPELGFGHVMGYYHDEQVLLIKTAMGNRALGWDFRPPSSGKTDRSGADKWEGLEYRLMVEGVRKTLDRIDKIVPGYQGQGYEIAGFGWFQGHKDSGAEESIAEYEQHLVNLINDVRKEFNVPKMPAVVATVGFGGYRMADKFKRIWEAQMAVGDPKKHPEFAGTVASVDIRDFWREVDESPRAQDYHYNRNAETYLLIGDAMGRAMVGLLGGQAEPLPQADRPKPVVAQQAKSEPTEEEVAAGKAALKPIILNGMIPQYMSNDRTRAALLAAASGEKPKRASQFLNDALGFGLTEYYRAAGVHDYDWRPFGPDLRSVKWDYYSFDPKETKPKEKGGRFRNVTYPEGMSNWFAPDFDATKAGWKKGLPPFGQLDGKLAPLSGHCTQTICGCSQVPKTLWEKEVLLIRGTFEIPPLKGGHRYRLVVGGSAHVNAGEGFAIYVNGKLLAESKHGVFKRQGAQPRGGFIHNDMLKEFQGGRVTLAATSFLRYNHPRFGLQPPKGHFTLWMEEQKIPPLEK